MSDFSRRGFLGGAAGALALGASAHAAGRVLGANETIRVGFIGVGNLWGGAPEGRCQAHISHILKMTKEKKPVQAVAVCDVFNRYREDSAAKIDKGNGEAGISAKCKKYADYRELLADKDIDVVCIATPDHWHAQMTIDACKAGKDVYCEKPMTHTIEESYAVVDAVKQHNRIMQVGVQSTANPIWGHAYDQIANGRIGKVVHAQTHYYRNSTEGQWRYYALKPEMTPSNIDWDMFLGHKFGLAPKVPFDRARFAQWRCYWDYGGGMFTDLFVHRITRIMKTTGLREPHRVIGAGGIYLEYDGRDVPDVSTIVADYGEGCQVMVTACMTNDFAIDECVRGHLGTIVLDETNGYEIFDQRIAGGPKASWESGRPPAGSGVIVKPEGVKKGDMTYQHWENFLACCRDRKAENLNNPADLGAAAIALVN
ncbi:MAG TPA: Gfo/Idh/MocA family oxidoreductase, partial [Planctomycetia bacterium]|nr:Gfo/Idh/MocA family oxidoreductase [Planctomycetia bacterium]